MEVFQYYVFTSSVDSLYILFDFTLKYNILQSGVGSGDAAKMRELESKVRDLEGKLQAASGAEELKRKLLETKMLYTTTIDDYEIVSLIKYCSKNVCQAHLPDQSSGRSSAFQCCMFLHELGMVWRLGLRITAVYTTLVPSSVFSCAAWYNS